MKRRVALALTFMILVWAKGQHANYTVYIFLGENCPICQYHTLTLNQLYNEYAEKGIEFIGVFPNPDSDSVTIDSFRREYKIAFELKKDTGRELMKKLGATITPQVFVVDDKGTVYYKGGIDDRYITLGKRKNTPVVPHLKNAIEALLNNRPVAVKETKAVGCFIDSE